MPQRKALRKAPREENIVSAESPEAGGFARDLLAWYGRAARVLPWRAPPGERADPYRVWLSEIMLQQTTVAAVGPYFARFVARWPDVHALAGASLDDVLAAWAGLGYYARARNLKKCAETVSSEHGGAFPDNSDDLAKLPGIGPYTAAAIAAIAFGEAATVVDGNVERVIARVFAIETPLPAAKPEIRAQAGALTPRTRPGDYAQAMMDLGATICRPGGPLCPTCPVAAHCRARALGVAQSLPRRAPKKARPTRCAVAWLARDTKGRVLLRRRAERGLLGGMWEVPSTDWAEQPAAPRAPAAADWRAAGTVVHVFTHFRLELQVRTARLERAAAEKFGPDARWVAPQDLANYGLPSVMKKVLKAGG